MDRLIDTYLILKVTAERCPFEMLGYVDIKCKQKNYFPQTLIFFLIQSRLIPTHHSAFPYYVTAAIMKGLSEGFSRMLSQRHVKHSFAHAASLGSVTHSQERAAIFHVHDLTTDKLLSLLCLTGERDHCILPILTHLIQY